MSPKEKAQELVDKMHNVDITDDYEFPCMQMRHVIKCVLIAVDEIIEESREYCDDNFHQDRLSYWQQVKTKIQKL